MTPALRAGLSAMIACSGGIVLLLAWSDAASSQTDVPPYPCQVFADMQAAPSEAILGSHLTVSSTFRLVCPDETQVVHRVVAIDKSASEDEGIGEDGMYLAVDFVRKRPLNRVAIVVFSGGAQQVCDFSGDYREVMECLANRAIRAPDGQAGTRIDLAIRLAATMLRRERSSVEPWRELGESIVVLTNGMPDDYGEAASREAAAASRSGIFARLECSRSDHCNAECIADVHRGATSGGAADPPQEPKLKPPAGMRALAITNTLPASLRLIGSSARPAPALVSADGRTLVWRTQNVSAGTPLTYS